MVSLGKEKEKRKLGTTLGHINSFLLVVSWTLSLSDVRVEGEGCKAVWKPSIDQKLQLQSAKGTGGKEVLGQSTERSRTVRGREKGQSRGQGHIYLVSAAVTRSL